jgi:hypothetical protein
MGNDTEIANILHTYLLTLTSKGKSKKRGLMLFFKSMLRYFKVASLKIGVFSKNLIPLFLKFSHSFEKFIYLQSNKNDFL